MRVGLVMHGLDRPLSGVTRVALELARALEAYAACELQLLVTSRRPWVDLGAAPTYYLPGCERVPGLMLLGGPMVAVAARRLALDVVHDPSGVSPFTLGRWAGCFKRVVSLHDAIAFRHPEGYSWSNNFLHRRFVPATLRNVDGVITGSQHARTDLLAYLRLEPNRVHVVQDAVSDRFQPIRDEEAVQVAQRYGLTRPYILHVGTAQARKNIAGLMAAFSRLHAELPEYQLALVGPGGAGREAIGALITDLGLSQHVTIVGAVPEADLPALYSAARLFVLPSLFEGFGLPVLEAMACGTPVVCSNATSLPEVAGDAALLVDPHDTERLVSSMIAVLSDPSLRASLVAKGLERARQFTWQGAAADTVRVYRSLLSGAAG